MNGEGTQKQVLAGVAVLVVIALIVTGVIFFSSNQEKTASPSVSTDPVASVSSSTAPSISDESSNYKDGSYTATGTYRSPGGSEKITVTVTLKDDVITETNATAGATSTEGREYQGKFMSGYESQVVGKDIAQVNLSRVSGSSLTSAGFNSALTEIKNQAKS